MIDTDSTVRIRPPSPAPPRAGLRLPLIGGAAVAFALLAGGGAWWAFRPAPTAPGIAVPAVPPHLPATQQPVAGTPPPATVLPVALPRPPAPPLEVATPRRSYQEILAQQVEEPTLVRLAENPRVFVADFPTLAAQAAALNRVAALIEKSHAPRDRVVSEEELARLIAATGQPAEQYYLGHNYRADDLARFFSLRARQGLPLRPEEARIEAWLAEMRRQVTDGEVALITLPRAQGPIDMALRESILRHEVSHGFYFVDPLFAGYVRRTWNERFPPAAREAFRRFLAAEGYDPGNEDMVINEAMAYLLFTPDPRFFNPGTVGMDADAIEALRTLLRPGVPEALRPLMVPPPEVVPAAAAQQ